MRLFRSLLVIPLSIAVALVLMFPGGTGVILGVAATLLYFLVMVARASDWT